MDEEKRKEIIVDIFGNRWYKINKDEQETWTNNFISNLTKINGSIRVKKFLLLCYNKNEINKIQFLIFYPYTSINFT